MNRTSAITDNKLLSCVSFVFKFILPLISFYYLICLPIHIINIACQPCITLSDSYNETILETPNEEEHTNK